MAKRPRVIIYDRTDPLAFWWRLGSIIDGTRHSFGVASWEEAIQWILYAWEIEDRQGLEVQVWGHGSPGRVLIAGRHLPLDNFSSNLRGMVDVFWSRGCETISGSTGKKWALEFVEKMDCDYVGHCVVTSWPNPLWQGRVAALRPGEPAWWADDGDGLCGVLTTRMKIPKCAYRD